MNLATKLAAASVFALAALTGFQAYAANDGASVSIPADKIGYGPTGIKPTSES